MAGIMNDALGVGLAAPQLGISQRLLVYRVGADAPVTVLANPELEWAEGKGDGEDADTDHIEHMDLTNPKNAASNPDGVVFYKIWHGRQEPRMPAFEDQLTKEQAWAIVAYAQTLRKK
jgi:hypothetical protein